MCDSKCLGLDLMVINVLYCCVCGHAITFRDVKGLVIIGYSVALALPCILFYCKKCIMPNFMKMGPKYAEIRRLLAFCCDQKLFSGPPLRFHREKHLEKIYKLIQNTKRLTI